MADQAPPENSQSSVPAFPAKIRVHALAKMLGLTSKQVLAKVAEFGTELRSAQSSVDKALAERVHAAITAPAEAVEPAAEAAAESAAEAVEPAAVQATADQIAEAHLPEEIQPGLFTDVETQQASAAAQEAAPLFQAPLFLQPEAAAVEPAPRRRRARRAAAAPDEAAPIEVTTEAEVEAEPVAAEAAAAEPAVEAAAEAAEERPETEDETGEGQGRRRRRGRRGRGRGRGEQGVEEAAEEAEAEAGETELTEPAAEAEVAETAEGETVEGEEAEEAGEGTSRRRRRRRRRKGSADTTETAEDDGVATVVHEREPRTKARAKDEVQGISGSTRLEAKRQRRRDGRDAGRRRPPILTESEFLARREAVDRVMVVREKTGAAHPDGLTQVAVLEDGVLVEHFVTTSASASMVGNVYLGRVQNVLPSMEAAFIDIGRGRNGVLYAGEVNWEAAGLGGNSRKIEQALKPGDQVLVQVSKDPVGHKGARLTTQISLAGRFLVYVPGGNSTGISRKLPDTERKRLKEILREVVPADAGVIIRTAAEGVSEEELARDVLRLQSQWADIEKQAETADKGKSGNPKALYEEPDLLVKVVRDLFNEDFSKIVIEGEKSWSTVEGYIKTVAPDLLPRVERYEGNGGPDVFEAKRIDEQLAKALDRKVWLPSGGTLVIDRTEAMTVVDVNTGKFTGSGGNLEETVTRNNLEAAEEIVRQMRLRDIGGMIVVDFIDMVLESNRDLVLRRLTESLGRDRTRHQVSEVTSLGLVQMTRKKLGTGLVEAFSTTCEHCHGRGILVHADPVEVRSGDDGGARSQGKGEAGGRRKRGRDKSPAPTEPVVEKNGHTAEADATAKRAHPVALAMAAHLHEDTAQPAPEAESRDETATEVAGVAETAAPAVAEMAESAAPEVVETPIAEAPGVEPAVVEVEAEVAEEPPAAQEPVATAAPARGRRRARRASRASAAPAAGEPADVGTVVVIPADEHPEPAPQPATTPAAALTTPEVPQPPADALVGDGAGASAEPSAGKRRPRRRAAARPAGPPAEA
ncbi:hypothetical protein GCM10023094_13740 [Rhodococcus olei]|uniref:S1 motif domain-containing protein n=1 Tax=Rhodococcus olei TaxID=2161675 RepID=A0ABP8NZK9_9NOCA